MPIFVRTSSGTFPNGWTQISDPQIRVSSSQWSPIFAGDIYNGTTWDRFFVRLTPVIPTVSNVSRTVTTLTFRYEHPGDTETNTPVRIEYQLKNPNGTIRESGSQTFNSGAINQTVIFPLPGNSALTRNTTYTFEARAVYTNYDITTNFASISRTTEDINVVAPTVSFIEAQQNRLTFRVQHPGDTQTNTPVSITRSLIDNTTLQVVSGPTTTAAVTGSIDQQVPFSGLSSSRSYTFVASANYPTYGLTSTNSTVSASTLAPPPPPPTYSLLPSTTSFSRGGSVTINVSTTNVQNGTLLYWRRINGTSINADFLPNNFEGAVSIQNNSASFTINTAFLNVTPGSFHQTTTTTTNSFDWRARVSSNEGYRGSATFTVRLYTNSARTNQVASTSNITITPEPYNVSVQVTTGGNFVTQYFIPGQFSVTTGEVNDLRTISGLSPLVTYQVQVTTRYTSRSPLQTVPAAAVTRSTFRNPSNLSSVVVGSDIVMTARSGAISNNTTGTGNCIIQFQLQRFISSTQSWSNVGNPINASAITSGTALRSVARSLPFENTSYRFQARSTYPNHGANFVGAYQTSSSFFFGSSGGGPQ